jgi:hypothetical protein
MQDSPDRFGNKKLLHIQRAVSGRVVMQQTASCVSGTASFMTQRMRVYKRSITPN